MNELMVLFLLWLMVQHHKVIVWRLSQEISLQQNEKIENTWLLLQIGFSFT